MTNAAPTSGSAFVVCDPNSKSIERMYALFRENLPEHRLDIVPTPLQCVRRCREQRIVSNGGHPRVAKKADTIFTMLPSTPQVKDVYLGESGILQALKSLHSSVSEPTPRLFIDSTTLDVHFAREVAKKVTEAGGQMIDAPVSGGVVGARAGTLTFMVGGPNEAFERSRPFLDMMGARTVHCGPSGTGLIAKLCNNHILVSLPVGLMLVGFSFQTFGQCRELTRWRSRKECY